MNYEVAPFPLNNPLTPTTFKVACSSAKAPHAIKNSSKFLKFAKIRQILLSKLIALRIFSKNITNFCQEKYQDSLRAGRGRGLKRYLKSLLQIRLLVKI